jgi:hypothetical protein
VMRILTECPAAGEPKKIAIHSPTPDKEQE